MPNDYKVLYRKYRPTTFDEIVGQKYSIEMLKNAVKNDKISHAYIFTGPRGTGKTSTAKIFAKTINCENPKDGIPCGKCSSCINSNNNADIIEIDAASNNGIDSIRELINNVKIAPSYSKYKIYIIDEVHELSNSAFNALLLTLEEPPSHIVFILATTNIEKVPITILSRCQRYDFKKLSNEELITHLKKIAELEKIDISDDAIEEIAYLAEGGCRDALSILNQLYTSNKKIDLDTVLNNYGSISMIQIKNIVDAYLNNQFKEIKDIFDKIEKTSIDYKVFLKKLIDVLFLKAIETKNNNQEAKYLKIKDTIFELNDVINKININVDPFLLIFLILIKGTSENTDAINKIPIQENIEVSKSTEEIIKEPIIEESIPQEEIEQPDKLDRQENQDYKQYIDKLKKVRINNCFAKADKTQLIQNKKSWDQFNEKINGTHQLKPMIMDSIVVLASNEINIVTNTQESIVEMFNQNLEEIEQEYENSIQHPIKFIACTTEEWEKLKKEYIKKLKEKYVYQIMEEPIYSKQIEKEGSNETIEDVFTIFEKNKIEIQ